MSWLVARGAVSSASEGVPVRTFLDDGLVCFPAKGQRSRVNELAVHETVTTSVEAKISTNPRVIGDVSWARLLGAGLQLEENERDRLLAGTHQVDKAQAQGREVLLFDDLYRSGATMNAISAALYDSDAAADVFALTITKSRSNQ